MSDLGQRLLPEGLKDLVPINDNMDSKETGLLLSMMITWLRRVLENDFLLTFVLNTGQDIY